MRSRRLLITFLILLMAGMAQAENPRTKTNIDFDWYFHLGDIKNGESNTVDYTQWRKLDVPHEWSIEADYSEKNRRENAFLPGGIGWYKKEIEMGKDWKDKLVFIEFDGIYMNSTVWVNGMKLGHRPSGYLTIRYDMSPYLKEGKNIISVRVDNTLEPSARWYSGAGIYRSVNLVTTNKIHVAHDGTWVKTPEVSAEKATVDVEVEIENPTDVNPLPLKVTSTITDADGKEITRSETNLTIRYDKGTAKDRLVIPTPKLWSPETPDVYYLNTSVEYNGQVVDNYTTRFGVRKLEFDSKEGFKLNGVKTKFKGVCLHQSVGAAGTALNHDIWYRRLKQLKDMGCNAIRTSHYPFAPEVYAMCDTMGIMVMDEPWDGWFNWYGCHKSTYDSSFYFLDWWETDLSEFIRRDRNHPSVVMWCMGNEVWGYDRHMFLQYSINKMFHDLDGTRPTTQAYALEKYLDIAGFNANGEKKNDIANFHKKSPEKLAVGTEIPHTRQTRGVYRTIGSYDSWNGPEDKGKDIVNHFPVQSFTEKEVFTGINPHYASSYDNQTRQITAREQWKQTRDNDFFIGQFIWTAFDYLGESWGWPGRTNNYGIIDLASFPKDGYYLYQSLWSDKPMVHLLPHWTHPGKEGVEIPMVVYTNGDAAELFLNGKSLGKKSMDPNEMQILWLVPYKAGTVTAVAYKNGKKIARQSVTTAAKPAGVKLTLESKKTKANRRDVIFVTVDIVDEKGNFVPYADNMIQFEVTGPYKLIGVENGDLLDVSNQKSLNRRAFMGKALLMLQATDQPGKITITGKSEALKSHSQTVVCE